MGTTTVRVDKETREALKNYKYDNRLRSYDAAVRKLLDES